MRNRYRFPEKISRRQAEAIRRFMQATDPGETEEIDMYHNDLCSYWDTGICDCTPEVVRPGEGLIK